MAVPRVYEDAVLGLAHLYLSADELVGYGVSVTVNGHEAFDVDDTLVEAIDLRHPFGERLESGNFRGKELSGGSVEAFAKQGIFLIAPGAGPGIELVPVGKLSSREEVVFDEGEGPLDPRRAVGVSLLVGGKAK